MPLVSILIPSYNHGRFLPACLDSIHTQTFEDWEVVLVDDGSKDDSVAIARRYAAQDPRVSVHVNDTNLGTYGTEQKALDLSREKLVAVMNSDDLWAPEKLEKQIATLHKHPGAPFCYTLGWMVDDEGMVEKTEDVHADWPKDEIQHPLPYLLYENRILASSVLFRRDCLRFETSCRYSGDWVALLEQSQLGPALCLSERLTYWRQHETNTYLRSAKQVLEEIRVRKAILNNYKRWCRPELNREQVERGLALNAINLQVLAVLCGHRRLAFAAAMAAVKFHSNKKWLAKRLLACALPMSLLKKRLNRGEDLGLTPEDVNLLVPLEIKHQLLDLA